MVAVTRARRCHFLKGFEGARREFAVNYDVPWAFQMVTIHLNIARE
jgi:hypothetical protein